MATFTGDVNKLVAAPMLQDLLVDKTGVPMAGGTVTMFHDNSRTTLKNWYYQISAGGQYQYITLPNPLTLSAAGTIADVNGVDTIPFYYPWDEKDEDVHDPYYVTIVNNAQTYEITRENFPFGGAGGGNVTTVDTFNNLIVNNGFWRNIAPNALNSGTTHTVALNTLVAQPPGGTLLSAVVAPSQHDTFRMPDIEYLVNNNTGTDALTFVPFPIGTSLTIPNNITPEYYISHNCSAAGSGITQKCYQFPISLHLNSLANVPFTFSIQAQNGSAAAGTISVFIIQDPGTGGTPIAAPIPLGVITLNTTWTPYTFAGVFPSAAGTTVGQGEDDGLYLQIQLPLSATFVINFTKPSIYLTNNIVPNNDFATYDQVDAIINSPRTGDLRVSVNPFYNKPQQWVYGWLPLNDGFIAKSNPDNLANMTRANADVWPLYNMLWNLAQPYDTGSNSNLICQMITQAGSATNYGANAYTDFNTNNNALQLTHMMGRVMMGTAPISALLGATPSVFGYSSAISFSSYTGTTPGGQAVTGALLITTTSANLLNWFLGAPFTYTESAGATPPSNLPLAGVYFLIPLSTTAALIATTFAGALAANGPSGAVVIAYSNSPTGTFTLNLDNTGAYIGEYDHIQLAGEIGAHVHGPLSPGTGIITAVSTPTTANLQGAAGTQATVPATSTAPNSPANLGINIVQEATFYNMFIKL